MRRVWTPPTATRPMTSNSSATTTTASGSPWPVITDPDIDLTVHNGVLVVTGHKEDPAEHAKYLYRGIAAAGFERRFQLADYVNVVGASLSDGILEVELKREVPEAAKPKKIAIGQASTPKRIAKAKQPEAA